jgi:hypothetical protein
MPVPENVVRASIRWNLPQGEVAVNTIHVWIDHGTGETLDFSGGATQAVADKVLSHFTSAFGPIKGRFSSGVSVSRVDAYHLQASTGHTLDKATAIPSSAPAVTGTNAGAMLPPQVSVVASLYGYHIGEYVINNKNRRGRIYLPGLGTDQADLFGRFVGSTAIANAMKAFIDGVSGDHIDSFLGFPGGDLVPIVLSRATATKAPIQQIRVDDVFDTQRRRSNALVPAVVALAAAA